MLWLYPESESLLGLIILLSQSLDCVLNTVSYFEFEIGKIQGNWWWGTETDLFGHNRKIEHLREALHEKLAQ